tara:strand:+ start:20660 stop:20821 length:162 start_codon:yes stop_codon:yes gene_type:complete
LKERRQAFAAMQQMPSLGDDPNVMKKWYEERKRAFDLFPEDYKPYKKLSMANR